MQRLIASLALVLSVAALSCETPGSDPLSPNLTSAESDKIKVKDDVIKGDPPQIVVVSSGPSLDNGMYLWEVGTTAAPKDLTPTLPVSKLFLMPGSWSPDGSQLAFAAGENDRNALTGRYADIAVMSVAPDGSAVSGSITWVTSKQTGLRMQPSWSPDGTKLAWLCPSSVGPYSRSICLSTFSGGSWGPEHVAEYWDGGVKKPVLSTSQPSWSPMSDQIIFANTPDVPEAHKEIFTYDLSSETVTQWYLPAGFEDDKENPVWEPKPGSKRILFTKYEDSREYGLYSWDLGSSKVPVPVVLFPGEELINPWWGPDGKQFTFGMRMSAITSDVWVANANGTGAVNLTNSAAAGYNNWFGRLRPK